MDVTTLKITLDASAIEKGKIALDQLSNAAKRAQAALSSVSMSIRNGGVAAASTASAANKAAAALTAQGVAAAKAAAAMRTYSRAATRVSTGKPGTVENATSRLQGGADASTGPVAKLGAALLSAVSPTKYLTAGVDALVAAGLGLVDWSSLLSSALVGVANVLEKIAPYAVGAAAALALMHAPALVGGIATVIRLMGTLSVSAMRTGLSFTGAWLAAIGPVGWVIGGISAVVGAAILFRDELTQIFGFDIVGAAKSGVNTIIAVFHGGYEGIVAAWDNLPAAIGDLSIRAGNAFLDGLRRMIQRAVTEINIFIKSIAQSLQGTPLEAFGKSLPTIANEGGANGPFARSNWLMDNPYAGAADSVRDTIQGAINNRLGTDYLGNFGTAISERAAAGASKLRDLADGFTSVGDEAEKAGDRAGRAAAEATDPWRGLREETKKTAPMVGEALEFAKELTKSFVSDLRQGLANGEGFWKSFSNAALKALDRIVDKLLNNVLDALFQVNQPGGSGKGFLGWIQGVFGWLLGGNSGATKAHANGAAFAGDVQMFAGGAAFTNAIVDRPTLFRFATGTGLMGEAGPEAILPLRRDGKGRLGVTASNNNQPQAMNFNFAPTINMPNAQRGAGDEVKAVLKRYEREFTGNVVRSLREIKQKGLA